MTILAKQIVPSIVATVAPAVTDDNTKGYRPGMWWFDTTHTNIYWCKSVATGAADWENVTGGGGGSGTVTGGAAAGASGVPVYDSSGSSSTTIAIRNLIAGANVTITDNHDGTITIAASGGGGGGTMTDWVNEPITVHATTTAPTKGTPTRDFIFSRRVGDTMEIRIDYRQLAGGSAGSGAYLFQLPSSYGALTIDSSKVNFNTISQLWSGCVGTGTISDETSFSRFVQVACYDTTSVKIYDFVSGEVGSGNANLGSHINYAVTFAVPITEWA